MKFAEWTNSLSSSPTILLNSKVNDLKAKGEKIINLVVGEPDFNTPDEIKEETYEALKNNFTKYTASEGILDLRKAICAKLFRHNNLIYKPENIVVTSGAKQAISTTLLSIINPGEKVLIPAPYWVSYPEMVRIARGEPIVIKTDESTKYKITLQHLEEHYSPGTKAIILNSPSNPTGMIYTREELTGIVDFCYKKNIFIISDEIYERIVFSNHKFYSTASISSKAYDITITINGLSKSHAMTGWRVGYLACSKELATLINDIQSHFLSHIASFIQVASILACNLDIAIKPMLEAYEKRLELACSLIDKNLSNLTYIKPEGAFYIFPRVSFYYGKKYNNKLIKNSLDLSELILEEARVAVVPGLAFACEDNIRLSLATSEENITNGIMNIAKVFNNIR